MSEIHRLTLLPAKGLFAKGSLLAATLFGLLIYLLLPAGVLAMNDDFGYLRSVVETLQKGRPWTDDWLAPWSAVPSALAALLYRVTGSFQLAIHLTLALAGAMAFYGAGRLFRARAFTLGEAVLCSALLLTFPTILWKSVEFTGVALYVPFLLLAVGGAEEKRWGGFLLWWALALATRQSAIAWVAMPMVELGRLAFRRPPQWRAKTLTLSLVCLAGAGLFLWLSHGMNKTHAQLMVTDHAFDHMAWGAALSGWITGAAVFFGAAGLGSFILCWRAKATLQGPDTRTMAMALVLGLVFLWVILRGGVGFDYTFFSHAIGRIYLMTIVACALAGWLVRARIALHREHLIYAGAYLVFISLCSRIWDYYFIDIAVFGLFSVTAVAPAKTLEANESMPRLFRAAGALLVAFHLLIVGVVKCILDRKYALCFLTEEALRSGRIEPTELSFAPFGMIGWHLYPWFITHEGQADANIAGFACYLQAEAVKIEYSYPGSLHPQHRLPEKLSPGSNGLIAFGRYRLGWFFWADYFLRHSSNDHWVASTKSLPLAYEPQQFPTSDAEWDALIAGSPSPPKRHEPSAVR